MSQRPSGRDSTPQDRGVTPGVFSSRGTPAIPDPATPGFVRGKPKPGNESSDDELSPPPDVVVTPDHLKASPKLPVQQENAPPTAEQCQIPSQDGRTNFWNAGHLERLVQFHRNAGRNGNRTFQPDQNKPQPKDPKKSQYLLPEGINPMAGLPKPVGTPMDPYMPKQNPNPRENGNAPAPPWVILNNSDSMAQLKTRFPHASMPDQHRAALYNMQGHLIRREWLQTDNLEAAVYLSLADGEIFFSNVVTCAWSNNPADPFPQVRSANKKMVWKSDMVVFITTHGDHFTGLVVNQSSGGVFWYDSQWISEQSERRFCSDMNNLFKWYEQIGAPPNLIRCMRATAGVVAGPQQRDGWSCGLYVVEWIRALGREGILNFMDSPIWAMVRNIEPVRQQWINWITLEFCTDVNRGQGLRPGPHMKIGPYTQKFLKDAAKRAAESGQPDQANDELIIQEDIYESSPRLEQRGPFGPANPPAPPRLQSRSPGPPQPPVQPPAPARPTYPACPINLGELTNVSSSAYMVNEGKRRVLAEEHARLISVRKDREDRGMVRIGQYSEEEWVERFDNPFEVVASETAAWAPFLPPTRQEDWEGLERWEEGLEWNDHMDRLQREEERRAQREQPTGRYSLRQR